MAKKPRNDVDENPPVDAGESGGEAAISDETPPAQVAAPVIGDPSEAMGDAPQMPEVQDGAVEQAREAQSNEADATEQVSAHAPSKGQTDFKGRQFDKVLHEVNPDGSPKINRDGWIACRRGAPKVAKGESRPSRSKVAPKEIKGNPGSAPASVARIDPEPQIQATAATTTALIFACGQMVGGEDFAPQAGEPEAFNGAFANYYRAKGIQDIPPGAMVTIVCLSYVMKRWNKPQFKERRESWWMKAKRWWNDWKFRKENTDPQTVEKDAEKV